MAHSTVTSLVEENRQLRVRLKGSESARHRAETQLTELQRRAIDAEAVAVQQLRRKEAEWMAEYDRSVQSLLKIIKHHEEEKTQLEKEVQQLKSETAVVPPKMGRSTQTESHKATRTLSRRNSVRFARKENDTTSDKDESVHIDVKMRNKLSRMQRLFEQLQVSKDRQDSKSNGQVSEPADNRRPTLDDIENSPTVSVHAIRAAVLKRLRHIQSTSFTMQHSSPGTAKLSEESNNIETQTEDVILLPKQESCSTSIQQSLEERNRLLCERLASHQKLLDELMCTKLKHASASVVYSPSTTDRASQKRYRINHVESPSRTKQQPLSPLAA